MILLTSSVIGALTDDNLFYCSLDQEDNDGNSPDCYGLYDLTWLGGQVNCTAKINEGTCLFNVTNGKGYVIDSGYFLNHGGIAIHPATYNTWINTGVPRGRTLIGYGFLSGSDGFSVDLLSTGEFRWQSKCSGTYTNTPFGSATNWHTYGWLMVTLVMDFPNGLAKLYVNASNYANVSFGGTKPCDSTASNQDTGFFQRGYYDDEPLWGSADEVGFWNRTLSQSEINQLYNSGTGYNPYAPAPINISEYLNTLDSAISPAVAYTNMTIYGAFEGNSSGTLNAYSKFYINGVAQATEFDSGIANNTLINISTLQPSSTSKGDQIIFSSMASNVTSNSTWQNSSTITILNAPVGFFNITPPDDYHNNLSLNVSFTIIEYDGDSVNCSLYVNNEINNSLTNLVNGTRYWMDAPVTLNETDYSWYLNCTDGTSITTTPRTYTYDITFPKYEVLTAGERLTNKYFHPLQLWYNLSINVSDINLYGFNTTCKLDNGTIVYQNITTGLTSSWLTYNLLINLSDIPSDGYNRNIHCTQAIEDWHTNDKYKPEKIEKYSDYEFKVDDVTWKLVDGETSGLVINPDDFSVSFEFQETKEEKLKSKTNKKEKTYEIYCDANNFDYNPDSTFPAHFVCGKNWIDAKNKGNYPVKVKYVAEKEGTPEHYEVKTKGFKFYSIGGLNINLTEWDLGTYQTRVNLFFWNNFSNTWMTDFESTLSLNSTHFYSNHTQANYSTTLGMHGYVYSLSVEGLSQSIQVNITNQTEINLTINGSHANSIYFVFRDELNHSILSGINITADLIGTNYSENRTTTNGALYFYHLIPDNYSLRSSAPGYYEKFYYLRLLNQTSHLINIYMSRNTSTEVDGFVYDQISNGVENAYIKVLRYDVPLHSYVLTEIAKTNWEGQTKLHLDLNTEFYKFLIEYPLGTNKLETTPSYIYETTLNFQIIIGTETATNFHRKNNMDYYLLFNNNTNNFRFTFSDTLNLLSAGCLEIYKINYYGQTKINHSCVNASAGTILIQVDNSSGLTYEAQAYGYWDADDRYFFDDLMISFKEKSKTGNLGLVMIVLLILVFIGIGAWSPVLALILAPLPLVFGSILTIIDINPAMPIGIEVIALIIAFLIGKKERI